MILMCCSGALLLRYVKRQICDAEVCTRDGILALPTPPGLHFYTESVIRMAYRHRTRLVADAQQIVLMIVYALLGESIRWSCGLSLIVPKRLCKLLIEMSRRHCHIFLYAVSREYLFRDNQVIAVLIGGKTAERRVTNTTGQKNIDVHFYQYKAKQDRN